MALAVVSVPLLLITTNVLQVTGDASFYEREFARYEVGRQTGLSTIQLGQVARALIDYLSGRESDLQVEVDLPGGRRPLFNEREIEHMRDVRQLFDLVRVVQIASAAAILGVALADLAFRWPGFLTGFANVCLASAGLTFGILVLLGGLSLVDFSALFIQFHLLVFSNDLWILDPNRDYLIMLFPEAFWFDATTRIAVQTVLQASAVAGAGLILRLWTGRS